MNVWEELPLVLGWKKLPCRIRAKMNPHRIAWTLYHATRSRQAKDAGAQGLTWEQAIKWGRVIAATDFLCDWKLGDLDDLFRPAAMGLPPMSREQMWGAER